jgi:hypothetical protein
MEVICSAAEALKMEAICPSKTWHTSKNPYGITPQKTTIDIFTPK